MLRGAPNPCPQVLLSRQDQEARGMLRSKKGYKGSDGVEKTQVVQDRGDQFCPIPAVSLCPAVSGSDPWSYGSVRGLSKWLLWPELLTHPPLSWMAFEKYLLGNATEIK